MPAGPEPGASPLAPFLLRASSGALGPAEGAHIAKLLEHAFTVGFLLGGLTASRHALLQFTAEHQHLLPLRTRSDHVLFVRNRNYRAMAAFGAGGALRGAQMAGVAAVYTGVKVGAARLRGAAGVRADAVDDVAAGMAAGSLFALAGKGHRAYHLRRGVLYGGVLGGVLAALRLAHGWLPPAHT